MSYDITKLLKSQELARKGVIYAPASFLLATKQQLQETCNGCGASGSWFRPPATLFFTWIGAACNIHDWMYSEGRTIEDKDEADRSMRNNMLRLIDYYNKWWKPTFVQRRLADFYYNKVQQYGGPSFWKGKN